MSRSTTDVRSHRPPPIALHRSHRQRARSQARQPASLEAPATNEARLTAARQQQVIDLKPLVWMIARRLCSHLPEHVDLDDLFQDGMLGLMEAIDRYDPSRGGTLRAYAEFRIRGAMVDGLRQADWVPRAVRRTQQRLEHTRRALRQELGREPGAAEVAAALDLDSRGYDKLCLRGHVLTLHSLDTPLDEDSSMRIADVLASECAGAEEQWIDREERLRLQHAMTGLSDAERRTLALYYERDLSLRRVGAELGVTESRAGQLRRTAIERLRIGLQRAA